MPLPVLTVPVIVGAGVATFLAGKGIKHAGKGVEAPIRWIVVGAIILAILLAFLIWKKRI